jgi:hypothetical protein
LPGAKQRAAFLRWALPTLLALVAFVLWNTFRSSSTSPTPETSGEEQQVAQAVDEPAGDPCAGLDLLDIEVGGDGTPQGVWLRNQTTGPLLVRPGGEFSMLTLTRIATGGPDSRGAKLWFAGHPRACQLTTVTGIDLARTLPAALAAPRASSLASPASPPPPQRRYEKVPLEMSHNPASTNEGWDQAAPGSARTPRRRGSAAIDAGGP